MTTAVLRQRPAEAGSTVTVAQVLEPMEAAPEKQELVLLVIAPPQPVVLAREESRSALIAPVSVILPA